MLEVLRRTWFYFLLALECGFLLAAPAFGDSARKPPQQRSELARHHFDRAIVAYKAGRYVVAAEGFEASHRLRPDPNSLFNAATAWRKAGSPDRAADAFQTALSLKGLDADRRKEATEALAELRRSLAYLTLTAPVGAQAILDGTRRLRLPATLHAQAGVHFLRLSSGGKAKRLELEATQSYEVSLSDLLEPKARTVSRPPPSQAGTEEPKSTPNTGGLGAQKTAGFVAVGAGVVLGITSVVLGVLTLDARDEFVDGGSRDVEQRERAIELRTYSLVSAGAAGVSLLTGVTLVLTAPTRTQSARVSVAVPF